MHKLYTINIINKIMPTTETKSTSLSKMKDKYIGTIGTEERDIYEYHLRKALSQITKKPSR